MTNCGGKYNSLLLKLEIILKVEKLIANKQLNKEVQRKKKKKHSALEHTKDERTDNSMSRNVLLTKKHRNI